MNECEMSWLLDMYKLIHGPCRWGALFQEFEGEFRGFLICGQVEPGGVDVGILWEMSVL